MADEMAERLALVTRPFADALVLGAGGAYLGARLGERGLQVTRRNAMGHPVTTEVNPGDLVQVDDVITVKESWF